MRRQTYLLIISVVLVVLTLAVFSLGRLTAAKKELASLQLQRKEIALLKDQYLSLARKAKAVEGRRNLTKAQGILHAVDEVFQSLGLKDKLQSAKETTEDRDKGEQRAEVDVQGVNMNEMVNILYRIDRSPMLLVIRKITLKTAFENPQLLDMTMTLSLISPQ